MKVTFLYVVVVIAICANPFVKSVTRFDQGVPVRLQLWTQAMRIIEKKPLFGEGSYVQNGTWLQYFSPSTSSFGNALLRNGGFQSESLANQELTSSFQRGRARTLYSLIAPHNVYLSLAVQLGGYGFIAFIILVSSILYSQMKRILTGDSKAIPLIAATVGLLFASMFDTILFVSNSLTALFAWLAASSFNIPPKKAV